MAYLILAGLALGPLLLARMPRLGAAPGGVVVRSGATVDVTVRVDGVVTALPTLRPLPSNTSETIVALTPSVQFAAPDALDRIAHALESHPAIAVYPWQKAPARPEAFSMFFVLWEALTRSRRAQPTALRAWKPGHENDDPHVMLGGYVIAEKHRGWRHSAAGFNLGAFVFFLAVAGAAVYSVTNPGWNGFGMYSATVFVLSLCLKQTGKFARLATWIFPLTLLFFVFGLVARVATPRPAPAVS